MIIYNAGTDCLEHDPLGNLNISPEGIKMRDELMFLFALKRKIPIVMILSGGYQLTNAPVIAESLTSIINKFKLK
jgi:histone deacetylase 11